MQELRNKIKFKSKKINPLRKVKVFIGQEFNNYTIFSSIANKINPLKKTVFLNGL